MFNYNCHQWDLFSQNSIPLNFLPTKFFKMAKPRNFNPTNINDSTISLFSPGCFFLVIFINLFYNLFDLELLLKIQCVIKLKTSKPHL